MWTCIASDSRAADKAVAVLAAAPVQAGDILQLLQQTLANRMQSIEAGGPAAPAEQHRVGALRSNAQVSLQGVLLWYCALNKGGLQCTELNAASDVVQDIAVQVCSWGVRCTTVAALRSVMSCMLDIAVLAPTHIMVLHVMCKTDWPCDHLLPCS